MTTRSNGTTSIVFTASRKLTSGVTAGDIITITAYLPIFDRSTEKGSKQSKTIDGTQISVLNYYAENYQCQTKGIDVTNSGEWEMFLYSTMNNESFTMTNREESDRVMSVKRKGDFSKARVNRLFAYYRYSFQIRELL